MVPCLTAWLIRMHPYLVLSIISKDWHKPNLRDNKSTNCTLLVGSDSFVKPKTSNWYPCLKKRIITLAHGVKSLDLSELTLLPLQWNYNQNTNHFIHENASENIFREMAAILYRGRWVKGNHKKDWIHTLYGEVYYGEKYMAFLCTCDDIAGFLYRNCRLTICRKTFHILSFVPKWKVRYQINKTIRTIITAEK